MKMRVVLFEADKKVVDEAGGVYMIPESALRDMAVKFPSLKFDEGTKTLMLEIELDEKNRSPQIDGLLDKFKDLMPFSVGSSMAKLPQDWD
jgi:hypothetical protein